MLQQFVDWFTLDHIWLLIGFLGQALFGARFLVQWIVSEKEKKSIIPVVFWYFSLGGGIVLLAYALYKEDPVFITGQALGLIVYMRNLVFIRREREANRSSTDF